MRRILSFILLMVLTAAYCAEPDKAEKPNLVPNGGFDADPQRLVNWDPLPADGSVEWLDYDPAKGKVIAFKLSKNVAESTGVLFYSDFIPVRHGKKYKFSLDYKSMGPVPKPFVKGYALCPNARGEVDRREYYKKQIFVKEPSPDWTTITMEFTPKNPYDRGKYEIKWVKVLLYAYLKPGEIYFDNVRIEEAD